MTPRLLTLRALGLGDLLTAVPALRALAAAYPTHRRIVAAPAWLAPITDLLDAVDVHLHVGELEPLPSSCRGVDVAVNLHGSGPQSHRLLLDQAPERLIAFHHPDVPATAGAPTWDPEEHEVERWCRLLTSSGIPADPADLHVDVEQAASRASADDQRPIAVVHPGAKSGARRWPAERFAAVAADLTARGFAVRVTGSPDERPLATSVATGAGLPEHAVLAGRTDLGQLASLVARALLVVAGDTGIGHLATATGTPSVLLFGPTPPAAWGPPPHLRDRHRVLWAGSTGDPLADTPFPGLLEITVDDVRAELDRLLTPIGASPPA